MQNPSSPAKIDRISDSFYEGIYSAADNLVSRAEEYASAEDIMGATLKILELRSSKTGLDPKLAAALLVNIESAETGAEVRALIVEHARRLRLKLFANFYTTMVPIEVSSFCTSNCQFCGWRSGNRQVPRYKINEAGFLKQLDWALSKGFSHIEIVAADDLQFIRSELIKYVRLTKAEIKARSLQTRVSLCLTPLPENWYKTLAENGVDAVLTWQETYDKDKYIEQITGGPKAHGLNEALQVSREGCGYLDRIRSIENAIRQGMQPGMGVMLGLSEAKRDVVSLIIHMQALLERYSPHINPIIVGMPLLNNVTSSEEDGVELSNPKFEPDEYFEVIAAIYLLALPDYKAWIFPNCRVPIGIQSKSILTAGCFTSTAVRVGPGSYLMESEAFDDYSKYFSKIRLGGQELTSKTLLQGEQFRHYYASHESYTHYFAEQGLESTSEDYFLKLLSQARGE